jgi:filamentous hemagglutinin
MAAGATFGAFFGPVDVLTVPMGAATGFVGGAALGRIGGLITCMSGSGSGWGGSNDTSFQSEGSTGRNTPQNLKEQLAMEQVKANPEAGQRVPLEMKDARWPAKDGWVKMRQNVSGTEVHYVRNTKTGAVADFKFK